MTQEEPPSQQIGIQSNSGGDITIEQSLVNIVGGDILYIPPPASQVDLAEAKRASHQRVLRQRYLTRLVERIGTLNLAQIDPEGQGIELERVYIDLPLELFLIIELKRLNLAQTDSDDQGIELGRTYTSSDFLLELPRSVEPKEWQVVDWWIIEASSFEFTRSAKPRAVKNWVFEEAPLLQLRTQIQLRIQIKEETLLHYRRYRMQQVHIWKQFIHEGKPIYALREYNNEIRDVLRLEVDDVAAACDRLIILGGPGSGKSTFVRHLALCLAGTQIDDWSRLAKLDQIDSWIHGPLTPIYVELRHFVASRHYPTDYQASPEAVHLWKYIEKDLLGDDLHDYAECLLLDLEQGRAVLILDGLDEVPYDEGKLPYRQRQLRELAASLNRAYPRIRILITSRPYAYDGWKLPGFKSITLSHLEDYHRIALAERLYKVIGFSADEAAAKAKVLNQQLDLIDPELKDRPLFLTLMATLFLHSGEDGLPTRRSALYRRSILLLLDRWTQAKPGTRSLLDILGGATIDDLLARLTTLAYDVHDRYSERSGTPEISEELLIYHLKPLGRRWVFDLITYLSENAAVLVCPGQNAKHDIFHFAHRTFQEYLAACEIVQRCKEADSFDLVRRLIIERPEIWRVPCTLVGDVLADTNQFRTLWNLLDDVLPRSVPNTAEDLNWWSVWLSGRIALEQKLYERHQLRRGEQTVRDHLLTQLVAVVQTPDSLPVTEVIDCGRILGFLGDPRPGITIKDGLPDIIWEYIPAMSMAPEFSMARYPITVAQYLCYLQDNDYANPAYLSEGGRQFIEFWRMLHKGNIEFWRDKKIEELNLLPRNFPITKITWYEAAIFCKWLSARLGYKVRLPTQTEWNVATEGAKEISSNLDNDAHSVGVFPQNRSQHGIIDVFDNVDEWSATAWWVTESPEVCFKIVGGDNYAMMQLHNKTSHDHLLPEGSRENIGFRVVRPITNKIPQKALEPHSGRDYSDSRFMADIIW